jgi:GT2 family glycosyltransferase
MVSIIICSINAQRYSAICDNLRGLFGNEPHEFIGIHDARSMAEGYSRGIRASRGDNIIVCHDDIEILSPDFCTRLMPRISQYDLLGVAGSTRLAGARWSTAGPPHLFGQVTHFLPAENVYVVSIWSSLVRCVPHMRVMDGLFLAGKRKLFESIGFDEQTFGGFHLYDLDFTLRASQAGFNLAVCNDFCVIHSSEGAYEDQWAEEARKFEHKHGGSIEQIHRRHWRATNIRLLNKQEVVEFHRASHWID